jgi:alpha,alpha-trehalase
MLSNLLQELALAKDHGRKRIILDESRLTENPVDRLSRMIKTSFWNALTRRIDGDGLEIICADPKNRTANVKPLIYVPHGEPKMADYYRKVSAEKPHLGLRVSVLPPKCDDAHFVKSLNDKPGILALAMREIEDGAGGTTLKGIPFVVPGARFNEVRAKGSWPDVALLTRILDSYTTGTPTSSPWACWWMAKLTWLRAWSSISSSRSSIMARYIFQY